MLLKTRDDFVVGGCERLNGFDTYFLHLLNGHAAHDPVLGKGAAAFTTYAPFILLGLLVLAFLPRGRSPRQRRRAVVTAGIAGIMGVLVSVLLGALAYRARPFVALPPGGVTLLIPHAADSSFPSDHVMGSAAIAAGVWPVETAAVRLAFAVMALLVAVSRVAVGAHWPSDVIASLAIGAIVGVAVAFVLRRLRAPIDWLVDWYGEVESRIAPRKR